MYHIVYKTTRPSTGEYYIGKHSTYNLKDGYQGSGRRIKEVMREEKCTTELLHSFTTESDAYEKERELVTPDLLEDPLCLNLTEGGGGGRSTICSTSSCAGETPSKYHNMVWIDAHCTDQALIDKREILHYLLSTPCEILGIAGNTKAVMVHLCSTLFNDNTTGTLLSRVSYRHLINLTGFSRGVISKSLITLHDLGYIEYVIGRNCRYYVWKYFYQHYTFIPEQEIEEQPDFEEIPLDCYYESNRE